MSEQYAHSPLRDVSFEIRFAGRLAVNALRHELQEELRPEFPELHVPVIQPGNAPELTPVQLKSEGGAETLGFAINRVYYITNAYCGFSAFQRRALEVVTKAGRKFGVSALNRVGLRYVNQIPFAREDGLVPLDRFFTLQIAEPAFLRSRPEHVQYAAVVAFDSGKLRWRLQNQEIAVAGGKQEALELDFDFYLENQPLELSKLGDYIETAHDRTKEVFESLLADPYRQVMKGDVS